jgi:hypothetical protein
MPTENKPADPKPTGLSQGWNLTRKNDGFVVGHQSVAYPPDEKAIERAERDGYVWVPFLVPAAQPQGEPVAWMDPRSPEMHATISNEVKQHNLKFGGAPSAAVNGYSIPLYAEQPAPVAVVMSFDFEHPSSKERRTVALSKQDVFDGMEDYFYDKIGEQICRCESVGETNVVDCSCDEYVHDFEIVKASLTS